MGIEPTRGGVHAELEQKLLAATVNPKCDWRVSFRGV
jgi:hypothetical protein